jgi:hypothetical protein
MPSLTQRFHVIVIDLRGMGKASRPQGGSDKKTMARYLRELVRKFGYKKVDIGGTISARRSPSRQIIRKLPENWRLWTFHARTIFGCSCHCSLSSGNSATRSMPRTRDILGGLPSTKSGFLLDYLTKDSRLISPFDRAVYHAAYATPDYFSRGRCLVSDISQDVLDSKTYPKLASQSSDSDRRATIGFRLLLCRRAEMWSWSASKIAAISSPKSSRLSLRKSSWISSPHRNITAFCRPINPK